MTGDIVERMRAALRETRDAIPIIRFLTGTSSTDTSYYEGKNAALVGRINTLLAEAEAQPYVCSICGSQDQSHHDAPKRPV